MSAQTAGLPCQAQALGGDSSADKHLLQKGTRRAPQFSTCARDWAWKSAGRETKVSCQTICLTYIFHLYLEEVFHWAFLCLIQV